MRGKIIEFNDAFGNEIVSAFTVDHQHSDSSLKSTTGVAMYHDEVYKFDQVYHYLQNTMTPSEARNITPPDQDHLDVISQILERWPASCRFPG